MCPYEPIVINSKKDGDYHSMEQANYAPMQNAQHGQVYVPIKTKEASAANPNNTYVPMQENIISPHANYAPMQNAQHEPVSHYVPINVGETQATYPNDNYAPMQANLASSHANYAPIVNDELKPAHAYAPISGSETQTASANDSDVNVPPSQANYMAMQPSQEKLKSSPMANGRVKEKKSGQKVKGESGDTFKIYDELSLKREQELLAKAEINRKGRDTVLGQGQYGKVKIGKEKTSSGENRFLAVKIIEESPAAFAKENDFYAIVKEKALEGLLVPFQTIRCLENNVTYQFMPLVNFGDGEKLNIIMGDLSEEDKTIMLRHVTRQLLSTFANMRANHVYHLDFKPGNFLLDLNGNVLVSDFGSAVAYDEQGKIIYKPETILTDTRYWSPEISILKDEKRYEAVDAWRLGVTLFEISCVQNEHKEFIENELLKSFTWRCSSSPADQEQYFLQLQPKIIEILAKEKVPSDIQETILNLMQPNYHKRFNAAQAERLLNPASADETVRVSTLLRQKKSNLVEQETPENTVLIEEEAPAKYPVVSQEILNKFIEEMTQYRDKHRNANTVIEINKKIFATEVLDILSTASPDNEDVVGRLKQLIADGEMRLKHQHFHRIKSKLGSDLRVLASAERMVSSLENDAYIPEAPRTSLFAKFKFLFFNKIGNIKQALRKKVTLPRRKAPRQK